ncbi:hypothetical protein KA005_74100 [bacterium]|nr:hypothetical protein [bacterium]
MRSGEIWAIPAGWQHNTATKSPTINRLDSAKKITDGIAVRQIINHQ